MEERSSSAKKTQRERESKVVLYSTFVTQAPHKSNNATSSHSATPYIESLEIMTMMIDDALMALIV